MTYEPKQVPPGASRRWLVQAFLTLAASPLQLLACVLALTSALAVTACLPPVAGTLGGGVSAMLAMLIGGIGSLVAVQAGAFAGLHRSAFSPPPLHSLWQSLGAPLLTRAIGTAVICIIMAPIATALVTSPLAAAFAGVYFGSMDSPRLREALYAAGTIRTAPDASLASGLADLGSTKNRHVDASWAGLVPVFALLATPSLVLAFIHPLAGIAAAVLVRFHVGAYCAAAWAEVFEEPRKAARTLAGIPSASST